MGQQSSSIIKPVLPRTGEHPQFAGLAENGISPLKQIPKLRELRETVFFRAEYLYLHNLVSLTGHNIHKACELSGLSRSRLYTLLKKYQITQPQHHCSRQK
jgi:transcriptional regulator of acetoin/glycerol metabolism